MLVLMMHLLLLLLVLMLLVLTLLVLVLTLLVLAAFVHSAKDLAGPSPVAGDWPNSSGTLTLLLLSLLRFQSLILLLQRQVVVSLVLPPPLLALNRIHGNNSSIRNLDLPLPSKGPRCGEEVYMSLGGHASPPLIVHI